MERISLGERGFYSTPEIDFNRETQKGEPFYYYTTGAAISEVLIDRFTGYLKIERTDLILDIGKSINPAIDRGQILGGFIQGIGWVTNEDLRYSESGELLSYSPTTYKIPNIQDIPEVFLLLKFLTTYLIFTTSPTFIVTGVFNVLNFHGRLL